MTPFEKTLSERSKSAIAVFHRFRIEVRVKPSANVFVEGFDDLSFYRYFLRLNGDVRMRVTFGKRNMDRIIEWFYAEGFSDTNTLFIRDSDFDRYLGFLPTGDHVFVTCGYSVENYVCSAESLVQYIKDRLCLSEEEYDFSADIKRLNELLTKLFVWYAPLMGAVIKRKRADKDVDLDLIDFRKTFRALLEGGGLPEFDAKDYCVGGIELEDFNDSLDDGVSYTSQEPFYWIRGHQLVGVVSDYLEYIHGVYLDKFKSGELMQFNKKAAQGYNSHSTFERLIAFTDGTDALNSLRL